MKLSSPRARRLLGGALLAYGLAGLIVLGVAGALIGGAVVEIGDVATRVSQQRDDLVATLRATSTTVHDAAAGMADVGTSLRTAHDATDHAAGLAGSLGTTLDGLSAAMDTSILGTRPFEAMAGQFASAAGQAHQLGADLGQVAAALATDATDLATTQTDLSALADRFDELTRAVEGAPIDAVPSPVALEVAFAALLLWLAIPAAASLALGIAILRGAPEGAGVGLG